VPVRALLLSSALTSVMLLLNASRSMAGLFTFLALMSTSSTLFLYFGVSAASLKLKVGGAVGLLALAFSLWTLWGAGLDATGWSAVLLLAGLPIYAVMRRLNQRPV
jgi:APA family basic amino acid/polyamine antiporter